MNVFHRIASLSFFNLPLSPFLRRSPSRWSAFGMHLAWVHQVLAMLHSQFQCISSIGFGRRKLLNLQIRVSQLTHSVFEIRYRSPIQMVVKRITHNYHTIMKYDIIVRYVSRRKSMNFIRRQSQSSGPIRYVTRLTSQRWHLINLIVFPRFCCATHTHSSHTWYFSYYSRIPYSSKWDQHRGGRKSIRSLI